VFGYTSDDEMCIMPGVYYELEANTDGVGSSAFAVTQVTRSTDNPATAFAEESFTTSLSGDGTRLAFTSSADLVGQNADGSLEVFTADLSTTPPTIRQLTSASGVTKASVFPALSNDGTTIVFTSNADLLNNGTNSDGNVELFVANFDGSNLRQLTNTPAGTNGPFLSSTGELLNLLGLAINGNGSVVAFTSTAPLGGRSDASQEVFLLGTDGGGLRQLTTGTVGNSTNPTSAINGVSITEDGSRIVFSSTGDYVKNNGFQIPQIFTIASDGSGSRQVSSPCIDPCSEDHPAWSPPSSTEGVSSACSSHGSVLSRRASGPIGTARNATNAIRLCIGKVLKVLALGFGYAAPFSRVVRPGWPQA